MSGQGRQLLSVVSVLLVLQFILLGFAIAVQPVLEVLTVGEAGRYGVGSMVLAGVGLTWLLRGR